MARRAIFRTGPLPTDRVEAFSDGVLAVVITLLVLEVHLPPGLGSDAEVRRAFAHIAPVLLAWAVSFAFVLTFWVNHHYFFASVQNTDRGLLWLNGFFLFNVTLIPFPTGLIGAYPGFATPLALLGAAMMSTSLSFALMRYYASFRGGLLHEHITPRQRRSAMAWSAVAPVLYALSIGLAFVWTPSAIAIQILVLAIFFLRSPARHVEPGDGAELERAGGEH